MDKKVITVALVDDHELLRNGLARIIDKFDGYKVIFEAGNGEDFIAQLSVNENPGIVLLDISMPVMDGFQTADWIRKNLPKTKVLVLSMLDNESAVIRMLHAGARGYILKDSKPVILKEAFDHICSLGYYSNDLISSRLIRMVQEGDDEINKIRITPRETEFLHHVCSDLTYKEIADKMDASHRTIDNFRDSLFTKFDIKSRVGLALFAIKQGYYNV